MRSLLLSASVAFFFVLGCGDDSEVASGGTGGNGGAAASQADGPMGDGPAMSCHMLGDTCQSAAECCTGACDQGTHSCVTGMCGGQGTPCTVATDCCNLSCNGGSCGAVAC